MPFYTVGGHFEKTETFTNELNIIGGGGNNGNSNSEGNSEAAGTAVADLSGFDNANTLLPQKT